MTIVKPKQTGSCGRGIRNEYKMLWNKFNLFTFNIICNIIQSITKKTACIWKFGIVDDGSSSTLNCQFVLVLL